MQSSILEKLEINSGPKKQQKISIGIYSEKKEKQNIEKEDVKNQDVKKQDLEIEDVKSEKKTKQTQESNNDDDDIIQDISNSMGEEGKALREFFNISIVKNKKKEKVSQKSEIKPVEQLDLPVSDTDEKPEKIGKKLTLKTKKKSKNTSLETISDNIPKPKLKLKKPQEAVINETTGIEKKKMTKVLKRITKKPDKSIITSGKISSIVIGDTIVKDRLPPKQKHVLIRASNYYMNNREKFINFINEIFQKYREEVIDDTSNISCDGGDVQEFSLLTHQKLVRDYINLYTPYRGLLLYHGLGSGKTCSSIAIAEGLKSKYKIVVLTPASLKMNYYEELKKCGDLMYKKNQFWEFINTKDNKELENSLHEILNLPKDYIAKQGGAWLVNVTKESNYDSLSNEEMLSLNNQINEMIESKYLQLNYNGFRERHLQALTQNYTVNPFDNCVVIIDEAHNFVSRIVNKLKKDDALFSRLYKYLLEATNVRIILLTGTPIINYPNEIGILFNILRGNIKSWKLNLIPNKSRTLNEKTMKKMFERYKILDYIEFKPANNMLTITRNPFGFLDADIVDKYNGVQLNERGNLNDEQFLSLIKQILKREKIDINGKPNKTEFKALPDNLDTFIEYFINNKTGDVKNNDLFKRRVLGLTSYFRSAQEQLMPAYDYHKNFHEITIDMSDHQFEKYEEARAVERKQETNNAKKKKLNVKKDLYNEPVSTYRIFSRAFCNFVFPSEITRPMPKEEDSIESAIDNKLSETVFDMETIDDSAVTEDEKKAIGRLKKLATDSSYEERLQTALKMLYSEREKFLSQEGLKIYSPKFLHILENLLDPEFIGSHLIYSQFRTLEGIGILKLVLLSNGFAEFKLKKNTAGLWDLDISEEDLLLPKFVLYTGTETTEEKEIIRNIFNGSWEYVPPNISSKLNELHPNNIYGEIIKVFMITSSGAEGISLKNVRHVHIVEPYWHPVRVEQVIGRARRICSHQDLPPELRTVDVYMYLMKISEEQILNKSSIELRLKDVSKKDKKTPFTSDQALYEIARIKEEINKQLLKEVKQSAIDCAIHNTHKSSEKLMCYSFGHNVNPKNFSYTTSLTAEESDSVAVVNKDEITWDATEIELSGKKYALRQDTMEFYDYDNFLIVKESQSSGEKNAGLMPPIGKLIEEGKNGFKVIRYS